MIFITLFLALGGSLLAQPETLTLSSGSAIPGSTVSLDLSLISPAGSEPAGLQWTFLFSPTAISNVSVAAGAAAVAAGKSLSCTLGSGTYTCVLWGLNSAIVHNGVVATATFTTTPALTITTTVVGNVVAATLGGVADAVNGSSATISAASAAPVLLASAACSPNSINAPGTASCTVTLNGAAPAAGAVVVLSSNSPSVSVPATATVASGARTAGFTATAVSINSNQNVTVTASLNGSVASAGLSLVAPGALGVSTLACNPNALASGATAACIAVLTSPALSATTVTLTTSGPVSAPASVVIPVNSSLGSFTISAGPVASTQSATLNATYGSSTQSVSLSVSPSAPSSPGGLAGQWNMDDGTGTSASDSSGNGNTASFVNNPLWVAGQSGTAIQLDGSSYLRVPSSPSLSIAGSGISFGATYRHTIAADGFLLGKCITDYSYALEVDRGAQQFVAYLKTAGALNVMRFPASVPSGFQRYNNTWVQVYVTYDGTTIRGYINGLLAGSVAATGAVASNSDSFAIGARGGDGSWTKFAGVIDDASVYNRALTEVEVQSLYASHGGPTPRPQIGSFSASPSTVTPGSAATLAWSTTNAATVTIDQGVGAKPVNGSVSVTQSSTTTYTLTATNSYGSTTATATVTVNSAPVIGLTGISCDPATVAAGGTVQCTVSVSAVPGSDVNVQLTSTGPITVPPSVFIAGSTMGAFTVAVGQFSSNQTATVTATLGGVTKTATLSLTGPSANRLPGLVGYWNLDDGSGANVADISGFGNIGTLVNVPVWTTGIANSGALQFSGNSYVSVPSSPALSINGTQISFGAWYFHTPSADGFLMGKTVSDYTYSLSVDKGAQQFVAYLKTGGLLNILRFPASTPGALGGYLNSWVHVFITYDGSTIRAYSNGVLASSRPASGGVNSNHDAFAIGARGGDGSWTRFNGRIDDVRVYNRALPSSDVQLLYSQPGQN